MAIVPYLIALRFMLKNSKTHFLNFTREDDPEVD